MRENAETLFVASEDIATALNLLESVEVEIGFDSDDPESIEKAILAVEEAINTRLSGHRGDARIESAILRVKSDFRCAILEQASSEEDEDGAISSIQTLH
ncbi:MULTISPECIES: hypothetical protein [Paraburkholderia]|jgi:hypothetical protein|uniref:Uncharacterized protein n=1 Tax=Paraburkholderia largidicola TaxID=3014751 RepID=A0A7I8BWP3_9BURK|nr:MULTISPECIES: hypothetical protein [Paraburkholderia]BCF92993.1 hypothetical protein PPGU16_60600 [Paraburkholderia sp. PGU16]BEU26165.1 hypothetical protein PBP221_63050 [Paraburkholderia sp. 22B1P]CAG9243586.1 conserved hypothetical protein [Paraburkholderia caribensis]